MKKALRKLSMLLTVVMVMSAFAVPAAAGQGRGEEWRQESGRERRNVAVPEIHYLDAEVRVVDGQPVLRYETEEGYADIPFVLSDYAISESGQKEPIERIGDVVFLPSEDGATAFNLRDFSVVLIGGQVKLLADVNPVWTIPAKVIAAFIVSFKAALLAAKIYNVSVPAYFAFRAITRGISVPTIMNVLTSGQRYIDTMTGARVVYHAGLRIAVIIDGKSNTFVTVYSGKNKIARWVAQNWSW